MITIFTTTKPSIGEIDIIQRNAIKSWRLLKPRPQIILFDNEKGAKKLAKDFKIKHVPEILKNEYGTPQVSDIFGKAQKLAKHRILAYVNADIILTQDFLEAISKIKLDKFLVVGRRQDLDVKKKIRFSRAWQEKLHAKVASEGKLHGPSGIDYFVFPRGLFSHIPNFALGRTLWDNWFLHEAWILDAPLIDATEVIMAVHQNHKVHIPRGRKRNVWKGPEAKMNQTLAGGLSHAFTIRDCSKVLTKEGLKNPKVDFYRVFSFPFRYYDKFPILRPLLFPGWFVFVLWRKVKLSR